MNIIRIIYRRTEQFISTSMCAQEVMNIEEQCAEHFRFTRKAATEQIQNFCHGELQLHLHSPC